MKIYKIILFLLLNAISLNAQKFELGKVSVAELEEKQHPRDSTAVAALLYNKAKTSFVYTEKDGFSAVHEYQFRIKIYKKEGLDWANYKVKYYVGYENLDKETLSFSNAVTYNLENGKIIKTKLHGEGSFNNNVNKYWSEASIAMPNVKVGSVIEFNYILKSQNLLKFPVFYFQHDIPVNFAEYTTEIPIAYAYNTDLTGYTKVNTASKIEEVSSYYLSGQNINKYLTYNQLNCVYTVENVPALKDEKYVDNLQNYRSSLHNELKKINHQDEPDKNFSATWEGVAKTIFEDKNFGKELNERSYLEHDLREIIKKDTTNTDKLKSIFAFVKNKMHWNNEYGYYTDKGVKNAYKEGIGNVAEVNFVLIAMLNHAGIKANPVLLSTVDHGIPVFPNRTVFNYVIAGAEIDGKKILLDATEKNTTLNVLPLRTLNWEGRLIREDGTSEEIKLFPTVASKEVVNIIATIDANGKITGKSKISKTDYEAYAFREKYANTETENYIEKLENTFDKIKISNYATENKNSDLTKPLVENFSFESENHYEIIGGKLYINPMLFFALTKNPFVQEKREMPIYFGFPKQKKFTLSLEIPQGYQVESLPKPLNVATGEGVGSFKYNIVNEENRIQIAVVLDINSSIISPNFYDVLKGFFQQIVDKETEKIVLKKI